MTLAFVLDSTGNGRIIEYDDATGQGSRGSGVLRKANSSAFSLAGLNGGWVFGMTGAGPSAERFVSAGQFTLTTGTISSGSCDTNDGGTYLTCTFTGTLSAVDPQTGRATVTLQTENGTSHEAVYVVSAGELVMEQIDPVLQDASNGPFAGASGGNPLLLGSVLQQSGVFTNASLNGTTVLYMQDINSETGLDESQAGIVSFDGNGNFNIAAMDDDLAGTISQDQPSQGTCSIQSNGALTINCSTGNCPAGFLVSQNEALLVGTGSNSIFGSIEPQTGGPFSNASLAGTYAAGSLPPLDYANASNELQMGAADGNGNLVVSGNSSSSSGLDQWLNTAVSYSIAASGRGTAQAQGDQAPSVVYMISPTKWLILQTTMDARLDVFQH